ncbi:unnamed protein product [Phaeothamnion confervicola]
MWREPFLDRAVRIRARNGCAIYVATLRTVTALVEARGLAPDHRRLSFVFNTGRCGSTLMHRMLGKVGVLSFSEPYWSDCLCQQSQLLGPDGMRELFHACIAIDVALCRRSFPDAHTFSVNFKGFGHRAMSVLTDAYPEARHIFMYRDPIKIAESFGSIFANAVWGKRRWLPLWLSSRKPVKGRRGLPQLQSDAMKSLGPEPFVLSRPETSRTVLGWADAVLLWMQTRQEKPHVETLTLRMDEFVRRDPAVVRQVLDFVLGDERVDDAMVECAMTAFDKHSQAGNPMAVLSSSATGHKHLSERDVAEMEAAIARVPSLGTCAFVVPGSLGHRLEGHARPTG